MSRPCLSVIVPVYNAEPYIRKCIASVLNQTFADFELVLIDDGSPDQCGKICDEYAEQDVRVKVIHKRNGGVSDARNIGVDNAKGDYISFVDPDDWIEPVMFRETVDFCRQNGTDIVCFEVCEIKHGREYVHYRFNSDCVFTARDATEKILNDIIDNSPCNKMYRKEVWKDIRFPVGRRFEDVATIYKTFNQASKIGYIKKYYYNYVKHKGSAIDLSFDAQRRYECFLGYKERYDFSHRFGKETVEMAACTANALHLSTVSLPNRWEKSYLSLYPKKHSYRRCASKDKSMALPLCLT